MRAGRVGAVMALTIVAAAAARLLAAQDLQSLSSDVPSWLRAWSPLVWTADLPRMLPSAVPSLPQPLRWGAPRVGLFWTAGNPGALPLELDDRFSAFRARGTRDAGGYRRPLDPARATDAGLSAVGWRSFETRGAAIGRVAATHVELDGELSDFDTGWRTGLTWRRSCRSRPRTRAPGRRACRRYAPRCRAVRGGSGCDALP